MGNPTTLADFKIGSDQLVIELIENPKSQDTVTIVWPAQPISMSARRFPDVAAQLTRVIASASMELARHKAGQR